MYIISYIAKEKGLSLEQTVAVNAAPYSAAIAAIEAEHKNAVIRVLKSNHLTETTLEVGELLVLS